ncbi:MAG: hypothetical protein LBP59_05480 [Planctomycetaceae bacterium]|nr:hypothetical protein [Planctomycetaceae bacterium]
MQPKRLRSFRRFFVTKNMRNMRNPDAFLLSVKNARGVLVVISVFVCYICSVVID